MDTKLNFRTEFAESVPSRAYTQKEVFDMLEKLVNATGSHLGTYPENKLFDVGAVADCLGQFMEKTGKFNPRIGEKAELNLPHYIIDLGSMIGVLISCLAEGTRFSDVLAKLDFYARFLQCFTYKPSSEKILKTSLTITTPSSGGNLKTSLAITTICMAFNGGGVPFWFGSTLVSSSKKIEIENKSRDVYTRQQMLAEALRRHNILLPLMPPTHQMALGMYIKSLIFGNENIVDEKAKLVVQLLQSITQPRKFVELPPNPPVHRLWEIVPEAPLDFKAKVNQIKGPGLSAELNFKDIKKFVNDYEHWKQQYGHCAETYPLLFILRSFGTYGFQGLSRSVNGICAVFYAGDAMECNGSGKCMMKCKGDNNSDCSVSCSCPQSSKVTKKCEGGIECITWCRQGAECRTRCCGGSETNKCRTTGTFTICMGRKERCLVCQMTNKQKAELQKEERLTEWAKHKAEEKRKKEEKDGEGGKPGKVEKPGEVEMPEKSRKEKKSGQECQDNCWRKVCERCMNSPTCCGACSPDGICLECNDFEAPCINCQALIDALIFKGWNKSLKPIPKKKSQKTIPKDEKEPLVNPYMIWDGWNTTRKMSTAEVQAAEVQAAADQAAKDKAAADQAAKDKAVADQAAKDKAAADQAAADQAATDLPPL